MRVILFIALLLGPFLANPVPIDKLIVPSEFKISLYAAVPGARSITKSPDGTIFVGTGGFANPLKRVYRIRDWNNDASISSDEVEVFIDGLNNPNGVAFRKGSLFVAEIDRILVFSDVLNVAKGKQLKPSAGRALSYRFPSDRHHGWKFIRFAPPPLDNWLYVPVGAPCNICKSSRSDYAAIHRVDVDGKAKETVAIGVRNSVGFDFHPDTGRLWFTDNGRDGMGDDLPADELNEVSRSGEHFGYPYCLAWALTDPEIKFDSVISSCQKTTAPRLELEAHVAALGMRFYRGTAFPKNYRKQIFIAEHGSWNRSRKSGYRVMSVREIDGKLQYKPFVTGWLVESSQEAWGRPVDIEELSDGSLLISDDGGAGNAGALYRVQAK